VDAPSSNAEVLKQYVEVLESKNWEAATAFWSDEIIVHAQSRNPLPGNFSGKRAFLEHYGRVFAELEGSVELAEATKCCSGRSTRSL
jgi:SnoaL-like domain